MRPVGPRPRARRPSRPSWGSSAAAVATPPAPLRPRAQRHSPWPSAQPRPRLHSPTGVLRGHINTGGHDRQSRPVASSARRHPAIPPPAAARCGLERRHPLRSHRGLVRGGSRCSPISPAASPTATSPAGVSASHIHGETISTAVPWPRPRLPPPRTRAQLCPPRPFAVVVAPLPSPTRPRLQRRCPRDSLREHVHGGDDYCGRPMASFTETAPAPPSPPRWSRPSAGTSTEVTCSAAVPWPRSQ